MSKKDLDAATARIEKKYGAGSVFVLGEHKIVDVPVISTGCLSLDIALGVGGIPRGRVSEILGTEGGGKTTLTLHTIAECQKAGGVAVFIDAEHALDTAYAQKLGVNIDSLIVSQPDYGEQALSIAEDYIKSNAVDLIVVDSVAALSPKAEIDGEIGDSFLGLAARMMSQALRKMTGVICKTNTAIIFINQLREKIGVVYGPTETSPGGRALRFYSSVRLDVRRIATIKVDEHAIGNRTKIKCLKNKVATPLKEAEIDLIFGKGFDRFADLVDLGVNFSLVEKSGSWYSLNGDRLGQGKSAVTEFLQSNPDVASKLEQQIRDKSKSV